MIVGLSGMPGSGKGVFVETAKKKGWRIVRMGDAVWDFVKKKGLSLNDENVGRVADEERKKHGYGVWAERTLPFIEKTFSEKTKKSFGVDGKAYFPSDKNRKTVIDGIRSPEEVRIFKSHDPDFIVIGIHSSPETRYRRIMSRKRIDDPFSKEKFDERDKRELSWGIGNVIALADVVIVNEDNVEDFERKIEKVLEKIV
ncbi:MAG: AAA family ATPase [Thermoplasmatales archaeon]|nr:AAA family ATPase [Thermoplasmatales archaeon]